MTEAATILRLKIDRFRGIESLDWGPAAGMNIVLGGGDVGKTTILEAIGLLLSPANTVVLSEADYWQRNVDAEFVIQAVFALPPSSEIGQQRKFSWPWEWDGTNAVLPAVSGDESAEPSAPGQPVYRLQVRGTPELEIRWEIVQPNDEVDLLSAAVRRSIGVVRLGSEDRNDRDLRLVYGSGLDRLLADKGLRARIAQSVSETNLAVTLGEDASKALGKLDEALEREGLPSKLDLGLTASQGLSIGALIGLLAECAPGVALPLASWGAGTRRMAALQVAAATEAASSMTVIDEIERGLEPYRLRRLVKSLQSQSGQIFITTHSAVTISAADQSSLWYLDRAGHLGALPREKIARQQEREPETFLTRFAIIAEGPTEVGFVSYLLELAIGGSFADRGVRVFDGQGNSATLGLLEALAEGGLEFGGFADHEGESPGRWSSVKTKMGTRLFQWPAGCTEQNIISRVEDYRLAEMIDHDDAGTVAERRLTLAARLQIEDKGLDAILSAASDLRSLLIAASTGSKEDAPNESVKKQWGRHGRRWFKSVTGGRELASKMFAFGVWPSLSADLMPFLNAVRDALGEAALQDIVHDG
ncbi:MAG: AAA family ATPase [Spirochaetaceae bacterium]|nr:AAA family ATPase [Spirochaetaceae bacterium]